MLRTLAKFLKILNSDAAPLLSSSGGEASRTETSTDVEVIKPLRGKGGDVQFKERAPLK